MTTQIYHHDVFARHNTGDGHPERSARIRAVIEALRAPGFAALSWQQAPAATLEQIALIHPMAFIERIREAIPTRGLQALDADTVVSPDSWAAALHAAGAVCAGVDAVIDGSADNVFCAVRPPGHHAEPEQSMGFCIFNSAAIGAAHARHHHGLKKVAVIDFDVHHGNGTQAAFRTRPDFLFVSTHQMPLYPGTGARSETGAGNIVNAPLPPYSASVQLQQVWAEIVAPAVHTFKPELIVVSAGFDAHRDDPLAQLAFDEEDYTWLSEQILQFAKEYCQGRVVSTLEGGYNLTALAHSVQAHVRALMAAA